MLPYPAPCPTKGCTFAIPPAKAALHRSRTLTAWLGIAAINLLGPAAPFVLHAAEPSAARVWNEECLAAIRIDTAHPPVQARNLFSLSVALYDAWAAYDPTASGFLYHAKHTAADTAAARREAMSHAAHRLLRERYALSRSAATTLPALNARMTALGYDPSGITPPAGTAAGVGHAVYLSVSNWFILDGARQLQAYADLLPVFGGYLYLNTPLITGAPGVSVREVNHWQRLAIADATDQNGFPVGPVQMFLGSQWRDVRPFALSRSMASAPWIDPGPPPWFGQASHPEFVASAIEVIRRSAELTPDDGEFIDISPGARGNNPLGSNEGHGHELNPATGAAYEPNRVRRGDFARVVAEFWADGPNSETPPGHWNVIVNKVADHPGMKYRIGGTGPEVDRQEWEVKAYFGLNGALHDAACAAWTLKRHYDGWRPLTAIRFLAQLGQCTDPSAARYHPQGLPLTPGLVELVSEATARDGERHAGLTPGQLAIRAWAGHQRDPARPHSGVRWIEPARWMPYQRTNFVTPPFPGYISGHSTFSRAAAEFLTAMTGSPYFPGGLLTYHLPANEFLSFERGPTETIQLQWATYFDAADEAGISRIWGGIHPPVDDFTGRLVGAQCGRTAWQLAQRYYDGSIARSAPRLRLQRVSAGRIQITHSAEPGFDYQIQSATNPANGFAPETAFETAVTRTVTRTNVAVHPAKFYRVLMKGAP